MYEETVCVEMDFIVLEEFIVAEEEEEKRQLMEPTVVGLKGRGQKKVLEKR